MLAMSTAHFRVTEHVIPATHIRHYLRTSAHETDVLRLSLKQYTPLSNTSPQDGDITILAAHANGIGKELYEPLWDELLKRSEASQAQQGSKGRPWRIRGIWHADVVFQGDSGVLNEHLLGDEHSWFDHPRDLLGMINHFREQMPPPLFGIGHSMGGNNLANLALLHPRLLTGLVLVDPIIFDLSKKIRAKDSLGLRSAFRRDLWASREEAEAAFKEHPFYKAWDPRVLRLHLQHSLRDLPTPLYPQTAVTGAASDALADSPAPQVQRGAASSPVTLKTTKHQEVFGFHRPLFPRYTAPSVDALRDYKRARRNYPDVHAESEGDPIYASEAISTFSNLPSVRPRVRFVFPNGSNAHSQESRRKLVHTTGTGLGGSGGAAEGAVTRVDFEGCSHFLPLENPTALAEDVAPWLVREIGIWKEGVDEDRAVWEFDQRRRGGLGRMTMGPEYLLWMKAWKDSKL